MGRVAKVAISLPEDMLKAVEKERKARGESRSEFFRRAVERFLKEEGMALAVREHASRYQHIPELSEEVEATLDDIMDIFSAIRAETLYREQGRGAFVSFEDLQEE